MKLRPYPQYKESGVPWLGKIPVHWPEKRAKYYFKEIDERSQTGDEEMLSVSHITGVTPRSQKNVTMFKAESNVGQKLCQPGDLVINTMWAWMSALGVSNHDGVVSPAYGVYRPRSNQDYDSYYLDHLMRIEGYRSEYICRSTGIRSSRLRLYPDKFLSMPVVCPPQEEQQTIARFLKAQDRLFRKFIRNKRRLIELLKEQKQNVINQAVTRGLDPNVKLKPSGVEWIGEIPEHWKACQLKRPLLRNDGGVWGSGFSDDGVIVFRSTEQTVDGQWRITDPAKRILTEAERIGATLEAGDLLVTKSSGSPSHIGKATLVTDEIAALSPCFSNFMQRLRVRSSVEPEYLWLYMNSRTARTQLQYLSNSTTGLGNLSESIIGRTVAFLPPMPEQVDILSNLKSEMAPIDAAIRKANSEIELMREYRARLISDVVTGQVDVRGIEVPEIAEDELLALEEDTAETDDVIDDEGEMDDTD